jgi:glycerophosphoryl diester phosphodiesterase
MAFTRAAATGADVLEMSVGCSSDGVFFGLHDSTIDRTTSGSGTASSLTWAQINSYTIDIPVWPGVAPQPHYKLEDFVKKFADTHVLMIDPKHTLGVNSGDMWDLVLSLTTSDRVIYKYSGNVASAATEASNRGLLSWGYLYDTQQASFSTYNNLGWDMLGLNYDASQAVWDDLASYGKKIVAHVIMSQASWDEAKAKGAHAAQCGRPDVVDV